MLTLFLRQTKVVSAGRTFFVHVGFLVSLFAFLKLDKLLRLVKELDKFLVFLLSFVNVS